ncbi:stabilizer of axonemal microtubules 1 [Aricia agestis]|uniref:stabilizer of axonemal microtubules 1 n=1 Tax=Aricia agestis TaxID=91739 RepID=UPI001C206757|nr:stabilizer of axonemal microtubules 1 [Aricia agestis]
MPECITCPGALPFEPPSPCRERTKRCCSRCCKKKKILNPCYKQPKIPESFAPRRCYARPTAPVECCTTYKMSYLPGCADRGAPVRPEPNIVPSAAPMDCATVHKLSYLPNPACLTRPIKPCHHDLLGRGPMAAITTQRHDYVPKAVAPRRSRRPPHKRMECCEPVESCTVNRMSYLPPERCDVAKSFAPKRCYERPVAKMDDCTTHKLSYIPNPVLPKEPLPWASKGCYQPPCYPIEANTVYKMSYLETGGCCRREPIRPSAALLPVYTPLDSNTIYRNSYLGTRAEVPTPVRPLHNLVRSCEPMAGDTVHKLSYLPVCGCPRQPIRPCDHRLGGCGPMQALTTQKHDYTPKPPALRQPYCPKPAKMESAPFESCTVNRLSYLAPGRVPVPASFAPARYYEKPAAAMENCTTQKLSYQPVCPPAPQTPPWARKPAYQPPCTRLDDTTIYRASFLPPGEDCSHYTDPCAQGDCPPCCCPPTPTLSDCACDYPRAECCT